MLLARCTASGLGVLGRSGSLHWPNTPRGAAVWTLFCVRGSSLKRWFLWAAVLKLLLLLSLPSLQRGAWAFLLRCTAPSHVLRVVKVWCDWLQGFEIRSIIAVQTSGYSLNKPCLGSDGARTFLQLGSAHLAERDVSFESHHSLRQTPNRMVMWETRHRTTARTKEKAGKHRPLVGCGVAGPRGLHPRLGQWLCEWHLLASQVGFLWERNCCCDLSTSEMVLFLYISALDRSRSGSAHGCGAEPHTSASPPELQRQPRHPLPSPQTNNSPAGSKLPAGAELAQKMPSFAAPCWGSWHSTANFTIVNRIVTAW